MKTEEMIQLSGMECFGGNGAFDGTTLIKSEQYDQLSEEAKQNISWKASDFLTAIRTSIEMAWVEENKHDERIEHVKKLKGLFTEAGFDTVYVKVIDNQYSTDPWYYASPWIIVTTSQGIIQLGWRKRVINLDWSESDIEADGNELFKEEEKITKSKTHIHCWSYEKAVEYLTKLRNFKSQENNNGKEN